MRIIPTYDLYGENRSDQSSGAPEFLLHCEDIYERSRMHGWEIKPHRHRSYFQILHIRSGTAELSDGHSHHRLALPCLVMVPVGTVHGFRFSNDVEGFVLTIAASRLATLLAVDLLPAVSTPSVQVEALDDDSPTHAAIHTMLLEIQAEYAARRPGYAALIESLLTASLIRTIRQRTTDTDAPEQRDKDRVRLDRLTQLVERHYREHRPVGFYARELGLSPTHLNRILKSAENRTVQRLLADRLIDDAKRSLIFSVQPIKTIALGLGFTDTAYFTRFFQRETGLQPTAYRLKNQDRQPQ
jgi:AraC family transcriptional regulator, transcriptional activator of pobA